LILFDADMIHALLPNKRFPLKSTNKHSTKIVSKEWKTSLFSATYSESYADLFIFKVFASLFVYLVAGYQDKCKPENSICEASL